jgi:tetratricopeptide (TPR) repeat protein
MEVVAPASRNSPCPCGSGKRYKQCHGAEGANPLPVHAPRAATLQRALAAQQGGRTRDAIRDYLTVLAEDPENFDAMHMLGVAYYQRGDYEHAHPLLLRASRLRPDFAPVRQNLGLVETAMRWIAVERKLAREVLPRMRWLCEAPGDPRTRTAASLEIHCIWPAIDDGGDAALRERLNACGLATAPRHWRPAAAADDGGTHPLELLAPEAGRHPKRGFIIIVGMAANVRPWLEAIDPDGVAWLATTPDAGAALDRLRELAEDGRRGVAVWFSCAATARSLQLPGWIMEEHSVTAESTS